MRILIVIATSRYSITSITLYYIGNFRRVAFVIIVVHPDENITNTTTPQAATSTVSAVFGMFGKGYTKRYYGTRSRW